ncbi:trans-1,2-dihydrobenzene-1,2-diol dehydrogenase [Spodoptera frugiperda]|uniref:Trans-1,2-dihydrobenzene-1,2-diol dehydrogenase n=1 Tax=Spodoptera frugiperda TaxID=7108 RepID=A0A9R0D2K7_SPOFR|nr:trans-1,2-dihydrobenzene-1,2-diol dehydrogenase [Spodoptera frugiperda]
MTIRWGIVSAGKISNDFVNALNSSPDKGDQKIVAVAARDREKANEFAQIHNIMLSGTYEDMARCADVDVVYIGALNPYHYQLTKLYLEHGKHVLCEKPFGMSSDEVKKLVDLAKKKNLFLMEAVWSRCSPAYLEMEQAIQDGCIGEVKFLEVNFGFFSNAERIHKKEYGGSAVLDIGVYVLQFAQFVFKATPEKLTAIGNLNEHGVDYSETIILEYKGGKRAVLNTHTQLELCNRATVYGTKGRITLEAPFHFPTKMVMRTEAGETVKGFELHASKLPYNFENSAGLAYEAIEVANCIKKGLKESPRMTHKESIQLAEQEDLIRKQLGVSFD